MTDELKEIINVVQELFADLKGDINDLKNRVTSVENTVTRIETAQEDTTKRLVNVENSIARMETAQEDAINRLVNVENAVTKIETTQENVTNKKIQLLAEGFQSIPEMSGELHSLSEDMETVKFDVDIVKKVVTTHSAELNKLGRAK